MHLSVAYDFLPKHRSLHTSFVMDHFGVDFEQGRHVIADGLDLDLRRGDVVFFTGPSGSGKSSLMQAAAYELERGGAAVVWLDRLDLPDRPLVDAMPVPVQRGLDLLSACGLSEAQLLLRTPEELSDGQRYRFRLALGIASLEIVSAADTPRWLVADEFSAALDRTLAKVLAFNLRRLATRSGIGFLLATTHDDIRADLNADVTVQCELDGRIAVTRVEAKPRPISFAPEIRVTEGAKTDWPYFAHWHYRSHTLGPVRRVTLLWHGDRRIGICVFCAPAASLHLRNQFFGLTHSSSSPRTAVRGDTSRKLELKKLNEQLWLLSRVVLHPTYRGAGLSADFVRQSCTTCPVPWIETLTALGHINPFFEKAGFLRVGVIDKRRGRAGRKAYAGIYGGSTRITDETIRKSRHAEPVYYVFDNRGAKNEHEA